MNFFNRQELIITMDLEKLSQVIRILNENGIKYEYKTFSTCASHSGTIQSIGLDKRQRIQYYIYVYKKDFDMAKHLINKI